LVVRQSRLAVRRWRSPFTASKDRNVKFMSNRQDAMTVVLAVRGEQGSQPISRSPA
jgi:hypothetical protein